VTAASLAGVIADSASAVLNVAGPFKFDASASIALTISVAAFGWLPDVCAAHCAGTRQLLDQEGASSTSLGVNAGVGLEIAVGRAAFK